MSQVHSLYHVCRKDDIGDYQKGYIGVTNDYQRRFKEHLNGKSSCEQINIALKMYNDLICSVLCHTDRDHALWLERELRPTKNIGWNLAEGGGLPPNLSGHKHPKSFGIEISKRQRGKDNPMFGKDPHNKGISALTKQGYRDKVTRRDTFKCHCKRVGWLSDDFDEVFAMWKVGPSGIRYRTYNYIYKGDCE